MLLGTATRSGYSEAHAHTSNNYTGRLADHTKLGVDRSHYTSGVSVATEARG